jgi:hypothetical protein
LEALLNVSSFRNDGGHFFSVSGISPLGGKFRHGQSLAGLATQSIAVFTLRQLHDRVMTDLVRVIGQI